MEVVCHGGVLGVRNVVGSCVGTVFLSRRCRLSRAQRFRLLDLNKFVVGLRLPSTYVQTDSWLDLHSPSDKQEISPEETLRILLLAIQHCTEYGQNKNRFL